MSQAFRRVQDYYDQSYIPPTPLPRPTLVSLAPTTSVVGQPVTVTVTGTNFVDGSVVRADGANLPTVFVSATSLTVSGTPLVDGVSVITVKNPDNQVTATSINYTVTLVVLDEGSPEADVEQATEEEAEPTPKPKATKKPNGTNGK